MKTYDPLDFIQCERPSGRKYRKYKATCKCGNDCGYVELRGMSKPCRECGTKRTKSKDYIWVETQAGARGTQRVRKVRKQCSKCGVDVGYRHSRSKGVCGECWTKGRVISEPGHNFYGARKQIQDFHTRSTYETFYAEYLIENKIRFRYEPRWFHFPDGTKYLPDFYLEASNQYVEIKGRMSKADRRKLDNFRKYYPDQSLVVLSLPELKELGYRPTDWTPSKSLRIKGVGWRICVLDDRKYSKRFGDDSDGITDHESYTIYIKRTSFSLGVIQHELGHAWYQSCMLSSADLSSSDTEEVFCEIMAYHLSEIQDMAKMCHHFLLERLQARYGAVN